MGRVTSTSAAPGWLVWAALWTIYLVWGSTYLAIAVMVETIPPVLGGGVRFAFAGVVLLVAVGLRGGLEPLRAGRLQLAGVALVGILLCSANALVGIAEREVPSGLAALLIASVPLWVILLRGVLGDPTSRATVGAVAIGFAGVALLLAPGEQTGGASLAGLLTVVAAAVSWASGSVAAPRVPLPGHRVAASGWQMLFGGLACAAAGLALGEAGDVDLAQVSARSWVGLAYLVVFGSLLAFTAYSWLLQNAPLTKVSTYAYVNPVVAVLLGWIVLDEVITGLTLAGAAIIVVSVALVIRLEARGRTRR